MGRYLVDYEVGDKVDVIADPSVHKHGFPHKRFHGKTGTIVGVRGRCFEVRVKDQKKVKMLVLGVEHMRKSNLGQNSA